MARSIRLTAALVLALAAGATACADGAGSLDESVTASFSLSQASSSTGASLLADAGPGDSLRFGGALIRRANIDSLIVVVSRVDVLPDSNIHRCHPPLGDSVNGFRPGPPPGGAVGAGLPMGPPPIAGCGRPHPHGPMGPRPDSLVPRDSGWGARQIHWYSLDVVGSGTLDLLALPTDSNTGLTLASGTLPAGNYGAARLIVNSATIWFDTTFTTANGFTFDAGTPYDVKLPMRRDSIMFIMTREGFTLDGSGADVVLTFDPYSTIGNAGVNAAGEIVIRPVLKPHRPRH